MTENEKQHTRDDIWSRINTQSESIAEIRTGQAATDARLGALETAVQNGFATLASEMHNLAERVHKPEEKTNPILLLVTFVTILAMFGSFALLIADPLSKDIARLEGQAAADRETRRAHDEGIARLQGKTEVLLMYDHLPAHVEHAEE